MKRVICMILALTACISLCLPASAVVVNKDEVAMNDPFCEIEPKGFKTTFTIDLEADGKYHQVYPTSGIFELTTGEVILEGTWSPTYARVAFELIAADGGGYHRSGVSSNEKCEMYAYESSSYTIYAKAVDTAVTGTVSVDVR